MNCLVLFFLQFKHFFLLLCIVYYDSKRSIGGFFKSILLAEFETGNVCAKISHRTTLKCRAKRARLFFFLPLFSRESEKMSGEKFFSERAKFLLTLGFVKFSLIFCTNYISVLWSFLMRFFAGPIVCLTHLTLVLKNGIDRLRSEGIKCS